MLGEALFACQLRTSRPRCIPVCSRASRLYVRGETCKERLPTSSTALETDDNQSRHAIGQNADILAVSGRGQDGRHFIVLTPVSLLHSNDNFQWLDTVRAVLGTSQRFRRRGQSSKNSHHRAGLHMQNIFKWYFKCNSPAVKSCRQRPGRAGGDAFPVQIRNDGDGYYCCSGTAVRYDYHL